MTTNSAIGQHNHLPFIHCSKISLQNFSEGYYIFLLRFLLFLPVLVYFRLLDPAIYYSFKELKMNLWNIMSFEIVNLKKDEKDLNIIIINTC